MAEGKSSRWNWKTISLAAFGALFVVSALTGIVQGALNDDGADSSSPATEVGSPAEADETPAAEVPEYTIARVDDVSMGTAVRFEYRVVVPGEPSEADLRAVIDDVVAEAKAGEPFNALSVGLYSSEEEIDGAYTLGVAELAPGGDWSAADTVDAGDYDAMELTVTIY